MWKVELPVIRMLLMAMGSPKNKCMVGGTFSDVHAVDVNGESLKNECMVGGTSSDIHAVDGNGESPDNGSLEILGDPLVANQRSEVKEICSNVDVERPEELNVAANSQFPDNYDTVNNGSNDDYGDWTEVKYYEGHYYYNRRTQESTWEPPPSMENSSLLQHVAVSDGFSSDVNRVQIHNENLAGSELIVDSVLTSSIVGYSDKQVNEPSDGNGSTKKLDICKQILDMNAHFGGFNSALPEAGKFVWVMNVVPTSGPNHLPLILDRWFPGMLQD